MQQPRVAAQCKAGDAKQYSYVLMRTLLFFAFNQKKAYCDDQVPANNKHRNHFGGKPIFRMASADGDGRYRHKKAHAKNHAACPNSNRLSVHYFNGHPA
jgi:hypothetical protein